MTRYPFALIPAGIVVALWVVFGRALFGLLGSYTTLYIFLLGVPITLLHVILAFTWRKVRQRDESFRRSTWLTWATGWALFAILGFTIPDKVDGVVHSILTGDTPGIVGMAIGISNPLGIIGIGMCVASIICAVTDAKGPRLTEDELLALED